MLKRKLGFLKVVLSVWLVLALVAWPIPQIAAAPNLSPRDSFSAQPSATETPEQEPLPVTARITPEGGGAVASADGRIVITFPSGAVREAVDVSYTPLQPWTWGASGMRVIDMFQLKASSVEQIGTPVSRFLKDVELTIQFSENYHEKELAGLDVNTLGLYYLDEATGEWAQLPGGLIRSQPLRLVASTDHFSIFGSQAFPAISGPGTVLAFQSDLHTGAATSRIAIEVPPGPGGFTPQVGLAYNSGSVDEMKNKRDVGSWVGIGWSLGLGSISYNPESNTYYLNLDGSYELVPDSPYYHTKPESFFKIKKVSPTKWEVWDREGTYYLFDEARYYKDLSRDEEGNCQTDNTTYYRWDPTLIRDTHGNEVSITYEVDSVYKSCVRKDIVSAYPLDIFYGKNLNDASSKNRFNIHFNASSDTYEGSDDGWVRSDNPRNPYPRVRENKRLNSIEIKEDIDGDGVHEKLVHRYDFTFSTTPRGDTSPYPAGRMTLTSLKQVGADGTSELPATAFTYSNPKTCLYDPSKAWEPNKNPGNPAEFTWPHLEMVNNGYGATVTFTYTSIPNPDPCPDTKTWVRAAVTQRSLNPGIGPVQAWAYSYTGDPQYWVRKPTDRWLDEYRGFAQVRQTDAAGNYSDHWYYTTGTAPDGKDGEKLTGKEYQAEWRDASGALLKSVSNTWNWWWSSYLSPPPRRSMRSTSPRQTRPGEAPRSGPGTPMMPMATS